MIMATFNKILLIGHPMPDNNAIFCLAILRAAGKHKQCSGNCQN